MAHGDHYVAASYVPGAFDEYYEPPPGPDVISPAPQRIMPEMSDQISEGIRHLDLSNGRNSVASIAPTRAGHPSPFPKLTNPPPNIPPSDEDFEATLETARAAVLSSNDPEMQLAWAEDALQQIEINAEDRTRLQNMQMRRPTTPTQEQQIKVDAMNIVSFLAEQHHPRAEFIKGMWWEFGRFGCQVDKKEAFRCYSRAADKNYARAEYRIGMLYEASNDPVKALKHYHKGNSVSDAACLYRLGMMTLRGQHGQLQDYPRGVEFVRQSAALADDNAPQGAYVYGMMLARELTQISVPDHVLPLDERQARIEIEKAAYMKFAKAQLRMGQAYELASLGCDFNPAYSLHYYALAARQGEPEAEMGISKWFLVGHEGIFPKNEEQAYIYAQRAALSGLANAEFAMGYFNELGIHIPKNIDLALEWYKKAAANGNTDAQGRIDGISQKQVLSKSDHEKFAINRIKSQYGSRRGQRPERFSQGNKLPSIGDGQASARMPSGQRPYPPRGSSAAPYPTNEGPPMIPELTFRPQSAAPYPDSNGHHGAGMPNPAFHVVPADRPYSTATVPDGRQRYPSGLGPDYRPATSVDEYGRRPNQRIVSSPAGMGPALPPKHFDQRRPSSDFHPSPIDPGNRRPLSNLNKPMPMAPGGYSPSQSPGTYSSVSPLSAGSSNASFPARGSSKPRPDLGVQSAQANGRKPSPGPDFNKQPSAQPPKPGARPPGKGPKTFEEMGVPAKKDQGDCIVISDEEEANLSIFRDCLAELVAARLTPSKTRRRVKGRKNEIKPIEKHEEADNTATSEDLADFVEYLAGEIFATLPAALRTLTYSAIQDSPELKAQYAPPLDSTVFEFIIGSLPATVQDSFTTYGLLPPSSSLERTLEPVFTNYITQATSPPPEHDVGVGSTANKPAECEVCAREHLPLTYHHLIPRQVHAKAVKRGWAREWELAKVAWLCRACHSFVHRSFTNEELARDLSSVDLLVDREDVQKWAAWVGRIRWKKR